VQLGAVPGKANSDVHRDPDPIADADANPDQQPHANAYADAHVHTHANQHADIHPAADDRAAWSAVRKYIERVWAGVVARRAIAGFPDDSK
jgi:hypothetical protein